jgi:hypothetical protein
MLLQDLESLLMLFYLEAELGDQPDFLSDDLVELLVLLVGIVWKVFVKVVLCDGVHDVVCHLV